MIVFDLLTSTILRQFFNGEVLTNVDTLWEVDLPSARKEEVSFKSSSGAQRSRQDGELASKSPERASPVNFVLLSLTQFALFSENLTVELFFEGHKLARSRWWRER